MEEEQKEEIKKILQESIAKSNQKKEKLKEEEPEEIKEEPKEEPPVNNDEETIAPLKEEKEEVFEENHIKINSISKDNNYSNILPTLIVVATLLLVAVIFSFIKDDLLKEEVVEDKPIVMKRVYPKEVSNENIQKEEVKTVTENKNDEVNKEETKTQEPKEIIEKAQEKEEESKTTKPIVKETKKEAIEQRVVKIVEIQRETLSTPAFKKFYNGLDYEKVTCYDYIAGSTHATKACKTKVKKFLEKNKSSIRFEIIGVLGEDDFKIFNKLNNIKIDSYGKSNKLKEFVYRGLARERVLEISWNVKEVLGEDTILTPTNYYVKSQKNNKGFIIKAFK